MDTSAIVAIVTLENDAVDLGRKILAAGDVGVGAPTAAETLILLTSKLATPAFPVLEDFLSRFVVRVIPFGPEHLAWFQHAIYVYGKGRHPAGLNYGDCMTYATARVAGRPLLYKGSDFRKTDIIAA